MWKKLLITAAVLTSLFALLNDIFIFMFPDGSLLWDAFQSYLSASSVVLIVLGVSGFLHAIYLGQTTGDFEYYLFPAHALLAGQGVLTFWYLRQADPKTATR